GTTSLKKAFKDLGFIVGNQRIAELLMFFYFTDHLWPIVQYCRSAQVFQDVPFSLSETYKYLDDAYPNSKFILSVRDTPEQWYHSFTKFHAKKFGNGNIPTADDLKNANYVMKGAVWKTFQKVYQTPENDPYNKDMLINHYINHNSAIREYFKGRPDALVVINLS